MLVNLLYISIQLGIEALVCTSSNTSILINSIRDLASIRLLITGVADIAKR